MTPAQEAALRRAASATGPIPIPAGTARVLGEQYRYIVAESDGWVLTPLGRAHLAAGRAREQRDEVEAKLAREDRRWAERVEAWLKAHERFKDDATQYTIYRYAKHVAACDHAGVAPVLTEKWGDGAREWVEQAVRNAADCLRDYDAAITLAAERGVGVSVEYGADPKVPRSRREAAHAAAADSATVVSLGKYRERRPGPGPAA